MKNSQKTINKYLSYSSTEYWDEAMDVLAYEDEKQGKSVKNKKRKQAVTSNEQK
jgi:glutaredoxin 2